MMCCRIEGRRCEEAVVEEGAFKDGMDEKIEGVPNEEDSEAGGGGFGEDALGEDECGVEN